MAVVAMTAATVAATRVATAAAAAVPTPRLQRSRAGPSDFWFRHVVRVPDSCSFYSGCKRRF
eukprot:scaffold90906_cov67-Phaeocystis_antarctica.AAC.6